MSNFEEIKIRNTTLNRWRELLNKGMVDTVIVQMEKTLDIGFDTDGLPYDQLVENKEYVFVSEDGIKSELRGRHCRVFKKGNEWYAELLDNARNFKIGHEFSILPYSVTHCNAE